MAILTLDDVWKTYFRGREEVHAVRGVTLTVERGTFLSVTGPSGSGKTTMLNLMAGFDAATRGRVVVDGVPLSSLDDDDLTRLRRTKIGIVFQFFNLLPSITALDNVALPLRAGAAESRTAIATRALDALAAVGLADRAQHRPSELSGGEMQRVAIARALALQPMILLADEPTGNLDSRSGRSVLELLRTCNERDGLTVVLVTHSPDAAGYAHRHVTLRDGTIADDVAGESTSATPAR